MDAICLVVAGIVRSTLPTAELTLAWDHSVEKTRWEERYRIHCDRLALVEARVEGLGAGMEPSARATLQDGQWVWKPASAPLDALKLTSSTYTRDWNLCWDASCRPLGELVGA